MGEISQGVQHHGANLQHSESITVLTQLFDWLFTTVFNIFELELEHMSSKHLKRRTGLPVCLSVSNILIMYHNCWSCYERLLIMHEICWSCYHTLSIRHDDMLIIAMKGLLIIHDVLHNHFIMKVFVTTTWNLSNSPVQLYVTERRRGVSIASPIL